jgi:hypothetical protein
MYPAICGDSIRNAVRGKEEKRKQRGSVINGYVEMWPWTVFDLRRGKNWLILEANAQLMRPGVYVLYRVDEPYYIGKRSAGV